MKEIVQTETYGEIVYEEGFWSGKKSLNVNGVALEKLSKTSFRMADGSEAVIRGSFFTGVNLYIGNEEIQIMPSVRWYEIVLAIIPFILVIVWGNVAELCMIVPVIGGAIGGVVSAVLSVLDLTLIKKVKPIWLKIIIAAVFLAATFGICCGLGYAFLSLIR